MVFTPRINYNEIELITCARHRNGVSGAPFDVALFAYEQARRIAVLFDAPFHCAVLDLQTLYHGDVNSRWRGDAFEQPLRSLIRFQA